MGVLSWISWPANQRVATISSLLSLMVTADLLPTMLRYLTESLTRTRGGKSWVVCICLAYVSCLVMTTHNSHIRSKSWPQRLSLNCCNELWFISLFTQHSHLIGQASIHSHCSYPKNNCSDCSVYNYKVKSMSHFLWRFSEFRGLFHWTK